MSDDLYMDAHLIRSLDEMNFGEALEALKLGKKVARTGWNGKGMWVCYFSSLFIGILCDDDSVDFILDDEKLGEERLAHIRHFADDTQVSYKLKDCLCMFTALQEIQLGWLASQADMSAEDWVIVI